MDLTLLLLVVVTGPLPPCEPPPGRPEVELASGVRVVGGDRPPRDLDSPESACFLPRPLHPLPLSHQEELP